MSNAKERTNRPAGVNDKLDVGYTYFASNKEKTNLKTGEGHEFNNDDLLRMLGFKDKDGVMTLQATSNTVERDNEGKVVSRGNAEVNTVERNNEGNVISRGNAKVNTVERNTKQNPTRDRQDVGMDR